MPVVMIYLLGGIAQLGAILVALGTSLLALMFLQSPLESEHVAGLVIGALGLLHAAMPGAGLWHLRQGRVRLALVLCSLSLLVTVGLGAELPGIIEAAARP